MREPAPLELQKESLSDAQFLSSRTSRNNHNSRFLTLNIRYSSRFVVKGQEMHRYRKYGSASRNQDTGSLSKEPLNVSLVYQKSIFWVEDTQIMVLRTRYRAKNCRRSWFDRIRPFPVHFHRITYLTLEVSVFATFLLPNYPVALFNSIPWIMQHW